MMILYDTIELKIGDIVHHKTDKEKPLVIIGVWFKGDRVLYEVEHMTNGIQSQWCSPLGLVRHKAIK